MALEKSPSDELDLDRTDRLPILEDVVFEHDVADDAVRLEHTAALPGAASQTAQSDFARPPAVDLPSLAESVRSVEERIARQSAEYEALRRLYEKARDVEAAAVARADALAAELTSANSALAVEQHRSREMERTLADSNAASEASRARVEQALRESERYQSESRTLRESLAARDATIVQVLHSLGERDAQLNALQHEHAQTVPALEARSQTAAQLEAELQTERSRAEAVALKLKSTQESAATLTARLTRGESELNAVRQELGTVKRQAGTYLESLRTREWRRGFDQNLFLEWDAKMDAAQAGHGALQAERDRLKHTGAALSARLIEQDETIGGLQKAAADDAAALEKTAQELQESDGARAELTARIDAMEVERKRMHGELAAREQALAEARSLLAGEMQRVNELLAAAEKRHADQSAQIAQLQAEAETHEEEMTVLMAHLNEARRPTQSILTDVKRLNDELALKTSVLEHLNDDNRSLRSALERTRGALEEREFLIRRLERSESNNANVLGRIQTSIERLGAAPPSSASPGSAAEYTAELIRIDGDHHTAFPLVRRTRIGRAVGCELQIDSSSVSRHHALLLQGPRELIIEDLNSTNGVLVNGRKVSRQILGDGDLLTIGEIQFRCVLKPVARSAEAVSGPAAAAAPAVAAPEAVRPGPAAPDAAR